MDLTSKGVTIDDDNKVVKLVRKTENKDMHANIVSKSFLSV